MVKASQPGNQKKNKGGRPRKGQSKSGSTSITWKQVSQPASTHHYEISSQGQVRRRKADGTYYDVKPWVSGGPYASVYIYGVKGATRNRKKVYVHRLVAQEFVQGKKPGNVVHHKISPASNTRGTLEWVTPSENLKARRFFTDDGKRRKRVKKVVKRAPPKKNNSPNAPVKAKVNKKAPAPKPLAKKPDKDEEKTHEVPKKKAEAPHEKLPGEEEGWTPKLDYPFRKKVGWLMKNSKQFKARWIQFRKDKPSINLKNFLTVFRKITKQGLDNKLRDTYPNEWYTRIISAMYTIKQRHEE
jgi:hypothetical protein